MGNPTEKASGASIFATVRDAHGARREQGDRRYHYSVACLLPSSVNAADLPGDEVAVILRELDMVDAEECALTVADLRAAIPLNTSAWRIPTFNWVLVFYRHVPIVHSAP